MNQDDFANLVFKAIGAAWLSTMEQLSEFTNHSLKNGELHSKLSKRWLTNLGASLEALAQRTRRDAQLSYRGRPREFLFDIVIHESRKGQEYAGKRLWAVESEFAELNKNVLHDFAKLLWADVENRLFICSKAEGITVIDEIQSQIKISDGTLFICRLPHPRDWLLGTDRSFNLREFRNQVWIDIKSA